MTQPAVLHNWYAVPVPLWAPMVMLVGLLLVLVSFCIDPNRNREKS